MSDNIETGSIVEETKKAEKIGSIDVDALERQASESGVTERVSKFVDSSGKKRKGESIIDIISPLEVPADKLENRERPGYHQTWKRNDEIEEAVTMIGYTFIREQGKKKDKNGKTIIEKPGEETGPIKFINEGKYPGGNETRYLYAVEIPIELYEEHLRVTSLKSHSSIRKQDEVLKTWADGLNSRIGKRDELVNVNKTGTSYEEAVEDFE